MTNKLTWWMRVVGVFYVLQFVAMAVVRAPIRQFGPHDALDLARSGDPLAKFLVDTWLIFGLEVLAVGIAVLVFSRQPEQARGVAWTVVGIELSRGILADLTFITRGIHPVGYAVWIVIHSTVIVTGLWALRTGSTDAAVPSQSDIQLAHYEAN